MRILALAQCLTPNDGWGTCSGNTVRGLIGRGHEVLTLVQTVDPSLPFPQRPVLPAPLTLLRNPLQIWKTVRTLDAAIKEYKPDIVHFMNEPYAFALSIMSLWRRLPCTAITACGTYSVLPLADRSTRWLMRRAYARLDHVFAISRYTEFRVGKELESQSPALAEKVRKKMVVWTLGIVQPPLPPPRTPGTEKRLVFVGGVKPRKGVHEVIEACGHFKKISSVPFHLSVIGAAPPGKYMDALRTRVKALGLDGAVTFRGHITDGELSQAYADADCFLMLSISHGHHFEGFGLVFLEANARGVPAIGPRDSGCENAIEDGRSGYLVHPQNPDEVAERLRWVLEENRIKPDECRAWVAEHSVERQAEEAEVVYTRLVRAHAR
ncbi:MAG: glycosyltransferase family 4 protein [Candidatus Peribacteraceae bacterium]|nr:glycosyltransferase family 4 protein [Candidatus Peribacteraceae bacterium]